MTVRHRICGTAVLLCAACVCAAAECRGEERKPLCINPSPLVAGRRFQLDVALRAPVSVPFDVYCFAKTTYGNFSLSFDGYVGYIGNGWQPVYRAVWGREFPYSARVRPNVVIPADMRHNYITFYLFLAQYDAWIPATFLEELGPHTANIIFFDSVKLRVK